MIYRLAPLLFWTLVAAYAIIFVIKPHLGPTDDVVFLRTLQNDKRLLYYASDFPYGNAAAAGRFSPLTSMEYNAVALLSNHPSAYFAVHAIQFIALALIVVSVLRTTGLASHWAYLYSILLFLLPGFAIAWFRLQLSERNVLFFLVSLVFILQRYFKKHTWTLLVVAIILATISLFEKETTFLIISGFALSHLILTWKQSSIREKALSMCLLASAALYIGAYSAIILPHAELSTLRSARIGFFALIKNITNFAFFSDPLLIFGLLPLTAYRLYRILIKKTSAHPLYDPMLIAATLFVMGYVSIRFYGPYYLLPAYAFALPACVYWARRIPKKIVLIPLSAIAFFSIVNSIPAGVHYITYNKYLPHTFNQTLDFLQTTLTSPGSKPVSLFLDGFRSHEQSFATYAILAEYLEHRGLTRTQFDLKSRETRSEDYHMFRFEQPYSVFAKGPGEYPRKDDLLLVTPQAWKDYTKIDFENIEKDYTLVFRTQSPFFYPLLTAKTLFKQLLARLSGESSLVVNPNTLERVDYRVYQKK